MIRKIENTKILPDKYAAIINNNITYNYYG